MIEKDESVFERVETAKEADLSSRFSLLDESAVSSELPRELRDAWSEVVSAEPSRVSLGSTRTRSGRVVTVVANDSGVCLTDQKPGVGGGTTCASPKDALNGRLFLVAVCESGLAANQVRVVGLLPDEVSTVHLSSEKERRTVDVRSSVFEAALPAVESKLELYLESGPTSIRLPLGAMALNPAETCNPPSSS